MFPLGVEVTMRARRSLTGGALVGACSLAFSPAAAEPLSDSEKIERLERQTEVLQKQLKALQSEIATTKKKAAKVEAVQAEIAHTKKKAEKKETEQAKRSEPSVASVDSKPSDPPVNSKPEE